MTGETKLILEKLDVIKEELDYIKDHMVDVDTILRADDKAALEEARKECKKGETTSLEDLDL